MKKNYSYISNLKFILFKQWKYERGYILALIGDVPIEIFVSLIVAYLPKIVLDCIENSVNPENILFVVSGISVVLMFLRFIENVVQSYEKKCIELARYNLYRKELINKLIDMDFNNFINNDTKIYKEKAKLALYNSSCGVVTYLLLNKKFFSSLFGFAAFGTIIARCNIWFIPILVGSYILSAIGWIGLQKFNDSIKDKRAKVFLQLNYVTFRSKNFSDAKDIRVFNMVDFLMKKINFHLAENNKFNIKKNNGHFVNVVFEDILKFIITVIVYIYLIYQKKNTDMTIGDFVLYFNAITGFGVWLSNVVDSITNLLESNNYITDYRKFLTLKDQMNTAKGCALPKTDEQPCSIEIDNLIFSYDKSKKAIINNLSIAIKPGEKIAIVGCNGAGKSTLVKLICGLLIPQSGNIYINGKSSLDYNRDEYYSMFSTVFQNASLLPVSIAKNIALCDDDDIDRHKLKQCIELAGLKPKIDSLPQKENTLLVREINECATSLSGGETQELLLARALYKEASIIILDEPTASLDPIAENNLYLKYNSLTQNKTAIYISHRLSSTKFCDRIILFDNANIAEIGTHEELISLGGIYANMFKMQSKYYEEDVVE